MNQRVFASEEEGFDTWREKNKETSLPGHYSLHTPLTSVLFTPKATQNRAPLQMLDSGSPAEESGTGDNGRHLSTLVGGNCKTQQGATQCTCNAATLDRFQPSVPLYLALAILLPQ